MKKTIIMTITLTIFAALLQSCKGPSSKLEQFTGEWKRTDKLGKDTIKIIKEEADIVILKGKDTIPARYDISGNKLMVYGISKPVIITYVEQTGHILIDKKEDGEYEKISH